MIFALPLRSETGVLYSAKVAFSSKTTIVQCSQERRTSANRGCLANALATPIPLTTGDTRHVRRQQGWASARRGYRYRTCNGASTKLRQPPTVRVPIARAFASSGAAKGRLLYQRRLSVIFSRRARVQGCHGGLTPPALVLRCERLPAKNDFCDAQTHIHKSGGREPAVGVGNALATPIPLTSGDTRHVQRQERRTSARRGCGKLVAQTQARSFGGLPTVYVSIAVAFPLIVTTGG